LQQGAFEKAQEHFQRLIDVAPLLSDGYIYMGDLSDRQGKLDTAEEWYQKGLRATGVSSSDCVALLRLYGRRELFARNKDKILPLAQRAIAIDPAREYSVYVEIGSCYQQNEDYTEAHRWYQKAVDLDLTRLQAYTSFGYSYIAEREYEKAGSNFQKAVQVAPEALDGSWGMAWLCESQGQEETQAERKEERWQEALHWYEESLKRRPEWAGVIRSRICEVKRKLGRYQEAQAELLEALRQEPADERLLQALHDLADDYYKNRKNAAAALQVYDEIRRIKGPSYDGDYQNRIGNLKYYTGDYQAAAEAYRKAIAADPGNAVYCSNLALACVNLKVPDKRQEELDEAISALNQALKLSPQDREYADRLQNLQRQRRVVGTYGEPALARKFGVDPITILLTPDLLPHILAPGTGDLSVEMVGLISAMRARIQERFGVRVPALNFRDDQDPDRPHGTYFFALKEIWIASGLVPSAKRFFAGPFEELAALQIDGEEVSDSPTGFRGYWIAQKDWAKAEKVGLWEVMEYPLRHLEALLERNLGEFVTHQELTRLLGAGEEDARLQIGSSSGELTALTLVVRALLSEAVPVRAFNVICKTVVELRTSGATLVDIVERVRALPEILPQLPGQSTRYSFYQLGVHLEKELTRSIYRESPQPLLALEPQRCQDILTTIRGRAGVDALALLVKNAELRPLVRKLVELEFPNMPVLSWAELQPALSTRVVGEIELPEAAHAG
jgi:tetratricopeptide (TPR) repeat protein